MSDEQVESVQRTIPKGRQRRARAAYAWKAFRPVRLRGVQGRAVLAPYLFVLPVLTLMGVFIYWPLVYSVWLSMLDWNFVSPSPEFVGAENFLELARDDGFRRALLNTGLYLVVLVPLLVLLPLGLAMLLWPVRRSPAQGAYRAVLFSPTVVSFAVAAVVWLWIFNPLGGPLNGLLMAVGGQGLDWLRDPNLAFWCIVLVSAWKAFGFNLILYVAALESVPRDYLEAARLDGAGGWALFRHVRFPLITPTFFFVLVTTVIFVSEEVFAAINVLTQGGPYGRTTNLLYFLYERGFRFFAVGEASATALVIFLAVMTVTWLQFRFLERHVHYG
jgi:multiple sugar transport system permease protein/sn-glycerol 3-phosphate transport system permease protein